MFPCDVANCCLSRMVGSDQWYSVLLFLFLRSQGFFPGDGCGFLDLLLQLLLLVPPAEEVLLQSPLLDQALKKSSTRLTAHSPPTSWKPERPPGESRHSTMTRPEPGNRKCRGCGCRTCPMLLTNHTTGTTHQLRVTATCMTTNM